MNKLNREPRNLKLPFMARPFIKWAGGKTQLLPDLLRHVPQRFGRYHEPFIGSAALFFALHSGARLGGGTVLSDSNTDLIGVYRAVRDDVEPLIAALREHSVHAGDRDYYYEIRAWDRHPDWARRSSLERAARMIFLNKTCFNGLHRVNRSGHFNVPFGRYDHPTVCDEPNLRAASGALQGVELLVTDFESVLERVVPGDLVYFDPPYLPISTTSSFTAYTRDSFGPTQHRRLAFVFAALAERGCYTLLSNSSNPLVAELYSDFPMSEVAARRAINSVAARRGTIREVIVTN